MTKVPLRQRRKADFESLWLITFADLMVQLMAFFAVIYSFSQQDQARTQDLLRQFKREVGLEGEAPDSRPADSAPPPLPGEGILPGTTGLAPDRAADLEKLLHDLKITDGPEVGVRLRIVSFRGGLLYPEGSSVLDPAFEPLLARISQLAAQYPGFSLVCEGHAAPGERGRTGQDALGLSGERATNTVRLLAARGLDPKTLAAEAKGDAYGEGDPSSPEGRALQRRVRFRFQRFAER